MRRQSFTFIELLVGIAIFSIISLAIYNTLSIGLSVSNIAKRQLQITLQANKILENLEKDLRNSVRVQLSNDTNTTGFYGRKDELFFFSLRPAPWPESLLRKELVKFGYIFNKEVVSDEGYLYQGILKGIEIFNPEATLAGDKIELPLKEFKFGYLASLEDLEEEKWQDIWPTEDGESGDFPLAVKAELEVIVDKKKQDEEETVKTQTFSKTIFLPQGKEAVP